MALSDAQGTFLELAERLRKLGAVRVRDGALEVAFCDPEKPSPAPLQDERSDLKHSERMELEALRSMAEEMP